MINKWFLNSGDIVPLKIEIKIKYMTWGNFHPPLFFLLEAPYKKLHIFHFVPKNGEEHILELFPSLGGKTLLAKGIPRQQTGKIPTLSTNFFIHWADCNFHFYYFSIPQLFAFIGDLTFNNFDRRRLFLAVVLGVLYHYN